MVQANTAIKTTLYMFFSTAFTIYFYYMITLGFVSSGIKTSCSDQVVKNELTQMIGNKAKILSLYKSKQSNTFKGDCVVKLDNGMDIEFIINSNSSPFSILNLLRPFGVTPPVIVLLDAEFI